jgi:hypothetical protein
VSELLLGKRSSITLGLSGLRPVVLKEFSMFFSVKLVTQTSQDKLKKSLFFTGTKP